MKADNPTLSKTLVAGEWQVDAVHSQVLVTVRHMAMASMRAKFPKLTGSLEVDAKDPLKSRCRLEIDAASVTTGHPDQEEFMRSEPWLDVANHPTITFQSEAIRKSGDSGYVLAGELTLRGVTLGIEIPFGFHGVVSDRWGLRSGFTSQVTLDRRDFGIVWNRRFDWGVMAGNELEVGLDIELVYPDEKLAQQSIPEP